MNIRQFFAVLFGRSTPAPVEHVSSRELREAMEDLNGHILARRKAIEYANQRMAEADVLLEDAAEALK